MLNAQCEMQNAERPTVDAERSLMKNFISLCLSKVRASRPGNC